MRPNLWIRALFPAMMLLAAAAWFLRPAGMKGAAIETAVPVVPPAQVRGPVVVWAWNVAAKSLQGLVPAFNRRYPNVNVSVERSGARLQTRVMLSLASGVGAPDVAQFQMAEARQYIATGQLADLTPVAAKYSHRFPEYLWRNCVMNGRVYAIPWDMGPCAVFYKRDIFRRYGIDPLSIETWDDYIRAGEDIVRKSGGRTKMLPLGSTSLSGPFLILMQQMGGQLFDEQGRIAINSPESRKALDIIKRMQKAGIGSDVMPFSPEFLAGFNADTLATYPNAVWLAGTVKDTVRDFPGGRSAWGVFPLPAVEKGGLHVANLGGSVLVIPAQCRNKAAAWALIEYALCTREGQLAQYRTFDLFPAFLPALEGPEVRHADPFFGGQPVGAVFARDVTKIRSLNMPPDWNEGSGYLDQALSHWAASGMVIDGFFERLEEKMHRRLEAPIAPASLSRKGAPR
jgi:lactose/L-arabinose transport system substrate-binding protein